jgi:hypothetical protein
MQLPPWAVFFHAITAAAALKWDWANSPVEPASGTLHARDRNKNGSQFLWLEKDVYAGPTFFECVIFVFMGEFGS